ncbi:MAG: YidH family protein [Nocardioidaceae bacterium]
MSATRKSADELPDARFILANERTLLAWLRTALAFVAIGVALLALWRYNQAQHWPVVAAAVSCVVGIVTAVWSYGHWKRSDEAIRSGEPLPPPTAGILLVAGIVVIAGVGFVAILFGL